MRWPRQVSRRLRTHVRLASDCLLTLITFPSLLPPSATSPLVGPPLAACTRHSFQPNSRRSFAFSSSRSPSSRRRRLAASHTACSGSPRCVAVATLTGIQLTVSDVTQRSKDCNETFPGQANGWRGRQYTSPVGQSRHSHWRWSWNSTTFDSDDSSEFSSSAAESETGSQAQFIRVTSAADSAASSASSSASSSSAAPSSSSSVFSSSSLSSSSSSSSSPSSSPPPSSSAPASSAQSSSAPSSAETTSSSPASSSSAAATTSSSSSAAAASSSSPATSSDLQNRVLAYHNDLRALHGKFALIHCFKDVSDCRLCRCRAACLG